MVDILSNVILDHKVTRHTVLILESDNRLQKMVSISCNHNETHTAKVGDTLNTNDGKMNVLSRRTTYKSFKGVIKVEETENIDIVEAIYNLRYELPYYNLFNVL